MSDAAMIRDSRAPSPTLRELAAILFRHSRAIAISSVLVFAAVLSYGLLSPRYEAHLKVLLRRGRSDPVISPQPPSLADFSRPSISEEELNSEVELLHDDSILRQVVVSCGLVDAGATSAEREHAMRKLASVLQVEPVRKSNLIQVRYRAGTPEQAAGVLESLTQIYVQKHLQLRRPSGELQFFEQQTSDYEKKLRQSEAELLQFSKQRGVAAPSLERDIALQKLGDAESVHRQLERERADVEQRGTALRDQLKSFPSRSVTLKRWADNPLLLEKLKSRLLELQLKRTELLTRYQPSYRLVQEIDHQIEDTKQSITAEALTPVRDETSDKDPNYEWARMELEKAEVEGQSLRAQLAKSSAQIELLRSVALRMESDSVVRENLARNAKASEDDYLLYRRKREEARIEDALDERRILNVAVIEAPMVPALPVHSMVFWLAIAVGFAVAVGCTAGFVAEYFDATIRTPEEAGSVLEAPVLTWLPESGKGGPTLVPTKRKKEAAS